MTYVSYRITTHRNDGSTTLASGTACGKCGQPIIRGHSYAVHAVRTPATPAPAFHYYHADHAPKQGSGWGNLLAGEAVTDFRQLKDGDVLLEHSIQFDSYNVIRITKTRWDDEPQPVEGAKVYGVFADPRHPENLRQPGDQTFCIWDHEIGNSRVLYRVHPA